MKVFWKIALFFFILQLFGGIFLQVSLADGQTYASLLGLNYTIRSDNASLTQPALQQLENNKFDTLPNQSASAGDVIASAFGNFYNAIFNTARKVFTSSFPLFQKIAWVPYYLISVGIPGDFAWAIFSIITLIELLAVIDFWKGGENFLG